MMHPDHQFLDSIKSDEGVESWNEWIEQHRQLGDLKQTMFPPESTASIETTIRTMENLCIPSGSSIFSTSGRYNPPALGMGHGSRALPPPP